MMALDTVSDASYPERFNFGADVVDHIARTADGPALIWANADGEEARFTYSDISCLSARLASSLSCAGIGKGDRIIVMLPRIPEWQIAMVACLKIGAVAIPCIEMLTAKDIAYRVEAAQAKGVIARAGHTDKFDAVTDCLPVRCVVGTAEGWASFAGLIDVGDPGFEPVAVDAEDPVILYFTSGSTGQPKGVLHAARGLYMWRHSAIEWLDLTPGDVMWCTADTGWSKAGTSILFGPWSCAATTFMYDGPFDPVDRLRLIAKHGVTVYCAAGTELLRVLDEDIAQFDLSRLRRTVSSGEALLPVVVDRWHRTTGHSVAEAYGQTESLMSLGYVPGLAYRSGSVGRALAHNRMAIIDDQGRILAAGAEGDIAIAAPNPQLMLGYWQAPDRTEQCYIDGPDGRWFVTGDRGRVDDDGYFFHMGRHDDVINSSGYRIGPAEVEEVLRTHPAVDDVAVVGAPDPARGEIVMAWIVPKKGYEPSDALVRELQDTVKTITAPYKYPRAIRFVDDLPRTPTGKIRRNILRERAVAEQR